MVRMASSIVLTLSRAFDPRGAAPMSVANESFLAIVVTGPSVAITASPLASSRPSDKRRLTKGGSGTGRGGGKGGCADVMPRCNVRQFLKHAHGIGTRNTHDSLVRTKKRRRVFSERSLSPNKSSRYLTWKTTFFYDCSRRQ